MTAAAIAGEVDEEEREAEQEGRTRPLRSHRRSASGREPQRQLGVGDGDRRQHGGVDAEQHDEVEREEGKRPAGARPRVEVDCDAGEHAERDAGGAEREPAPPVQAQSLPGVGEREVARAHERHRAVGECRRQRTGEHGQHEQRRAPRPRRPRRRRAPLRAAALTGTRRHEFRYRSPQASPRARRALIP